MIGIDEGRLQAALSTPEIVYTYITQVSPQAKS